MRLCLALPGLNFGDGANTVIPAAALARALSKHFDVTLAARSFEAAPPSGVKAVPILSDAPPPDDITGTARAYYVGRTIREELAYLRALKTFAWSRARDFDVVIERQWRYAGTLASAFASLGVQAGFMFEGEIFHNHPPPWHRRPRKRAGYETLRVLSSRARRGGLREADFVICETEEVARQLTALYGNRGSARRSVIPIGVAKEIFRPRDRSSARAALGIAPDVLVVTYVGALNGSIQCPASLIAGLARSGRRQIELHILGKGDRQAEREREARSLGAPTFFHGHRSQEEAALYVAAADLCAAPYRTSFYPGGIFSSASCKVPEYLSSGRVVLTIPCTRMDFLTDGGRYGFLVENAPAAYAAFFATLVPEAIAAKEAALAHDLSLGDLARSERVLDWDAVADRYARVIASGSAH